MDRANLCCELWNDKDFLKRCRLCACPAGDTCTDINSDKDSRKLIEQIETCTGIEVKENDSLPHLICSRCYIMLRVCFPFVVEARHAQFTLTYWQYISRNLPLPEGVEYPVGYKIEEVPCRQQSQNYDDGFRISKQQVNHSTGSNVVIKKEYSVIGNQKSLEDISPSKVRRAGKQRKLRQSTEGHGSNLMIKKKALKSKQSHQKWRPGKLILRKNLVTATNPSVNHITQSVLQKNHPHESKEVETSVDKTMPYNSSELRVSVNGQNVANQAESNQQTVSITPSILPHAALVENKKSDQMSSEERPIKTSCEIGVKYDISTYKVQNDASLPTVLGVGVKVDISTNLPEFKILKSVPDVSSDRIHHSGAIPSSAATAKEENEFIGISNDKMECVAENCIMNANDVNESNAISKVEAERIQNLQQMSSLAATVEETNEFDFSTDQIEDATEKSVANAVDVNKTSNICEKEIVKNEDVHSLTVPSVTNVINDPAFLTGSRTSVIGENVSESKECISEVESMSASASCESTREGLKLDSIDVHSETTDENLKVTVNDSIQDRNTSEKDKDVQLNRATTKHKKIIEPIFNLKRSCFMKEIADTSFKPIVIDLVDDEIEDSVVKHVIFRTGVNFKENKKQTENVIIHDSKDLKPLLVDVVKVVKGDIVEDMDVSERTEIECTDEKMLKMNVEEHGSDLSKVRSDVVSDEESMGINILGVNEAIKGNKPCKEMLEDDTLTEHPETTQVCENSEAMEVDETTESSKVLSRTSDGCVTSKKGDNTFKTSELCSSKRVLSISEQSSSGLSRVPTDVLTVEESMEINNVEVSEATEVTKPCEEISENNTLMVHSENTQVRKNSEATEADETTKSSKLLSKTSDGSVASKKEDDIFKTSELCSNKGDISISKQSSEEDETPRNNLDPSKLSASAYLAPAACIPPICNETTPEKSENHIPKKNKTSVAKEKPPATVPDNFSPRRTRTKARCKNPNCCNDLLTNSQKKCGSKPDLSPARPSASPMKETLQTPSPTKRKGTRSSSVNDTQQKKARKKDPTLHAVKDSASDSEKLGQAFKEEAEAKASLIERNYRDTITSTVNPEAVKTSEITPARHVEVTATHGHRGTTRTSTHDVFKSRRSLSISYKEMSTTNTQSGEAELSQTQTIDESGKIDDKFQNKIEICNSASPYAEVAAVNTEKGMLQDQDMSLNSNASIEIHPVEVDSKNVGKLKIDGVRKLRSYRSNSGNKENSMKSSLVSLLQNSEDMETESDIEFTGSAKAHLSVNMLDSNDNSKLNEDHTSSSNMKFGVINTDKEQSRIPEQLSSDDVEESNLITGKTEGNVHEDVPSTCGILVSPGSLRGKNKTKGKKKCVSFACPLEVFSPSDVELDADGDSLTRRGILKTSLSDVSSVDSCSDRPNTSDIQQEADMHNPGVIDFKQMPLNDGKMSRASRICRLVLSPPELQNNTTSPVGSKESVSQELHSSPPLSTERDTKSNLTPQGKERRSSRVNRILNLVIAPNQKTQKKLAACGESDNWCQTATVEPEQNSLENKESKTATGTEEIIPSACSSEATNTEALLSKTEIFTEDCISSCEIEDHSNDTPNKYSVLSSLPGPKLESQKKSILLDFTEALNLLDNDVPSACETNSSDEIENSNISASSQPGEGLNKGSESNKMEETILNPVTSLVSNEENTSAFSKPNEEPPNRASDTLKLSPRLEENLSRASRIFRLVNSPRTTDLLHAKKDVPSPSQKMSSPAVSGRSIRASRIFNLACPNQGNSTHVSLQLTQTAESSPSLNETVAKKDSSVQENGEKENETSQVPDSVQTPVTRRTFKRKLLDESNLTPDREAQILIMNSEPSAEHTKVMKADSLHENSNSVAPAENKLKIAKVDSTDSPRLDVDLLEASEVRDKLGHEVHALDKDSVSEEEELPANVNGDIQRRRFCCYKCSTSFACEKELKFHVAVMHANSSKRFSCDLCKSEFPSKAKLTLHQKKAHTFVKDLIKS